LHSLWNFLDLAVADNGRVPGMAGGPDKIRFYGRWLRAS
jgi:hypothetical protein